MELSPEKSYDVRTPEEYARIYERLRIPGEKKPIQDRDHLSDKVGLATFATLKMQQGTDTPSDHQDILSAEETLENRYKIRGDVRSSIRPTFHSIKTVGREVNKKLSEIVDLRKRIIEEVAQHALTLDKKRDLHRQLLDAETFITQKNAQITLLQQQIKNITTGNAEASEMLNQGRSDMAEELEKTVGQVSEISKITKEAEEKIKQDIIDLKTTSAQPEQKEGGNNSQIVTATPTNAAERIVNIPKPAEKGDTFSVEAGTAVTTSPTAKVEPEVTAKTETKPTPSSAPAVAPTPEKKKVGVISPEIATKNVDIFIDEIEKDWGNDPIYRDGVIKRVEATIKILDGNCDDKELVKKLTARLRAAVDNLGKKQPKPIKKPTTKKKNPVVGPEIKETPVATEQDLAHDKKIERRVGIAKGALIATSAAIAGFGLAASQAPEKFDLATRQALAQKIETPAKEVSSVEKIGNITIENKTITVDGIMFLLATLEKKGDYYIGSYKFGEGVKYIAVPSAEVLRTLVIAKNDEEVKTLLSGFANMVLIENPLLPGISVITGRTEGGRAIISYSFKREEREVKEAKDKHIEIAENPVAKEIFGKKYNEYVRSLQNLTLDQFRSLTHDEIVGIEKEVKVLGEKLLTYKYNEAARNRKIGDLLNELA